MLRATFKSLLSRKLRLLLSGLAVLLGVMFVSGSFVLTDTLNRSFDNLFSGIFAHTDVQVSAKTAPDSYRAATVPASTLEKVRAVPGVASATGQVQADGARVIGTNGKVVSTVGAPRFGGNWTGEDETVQLGEDRRTQGR
jgi:putative ABC transport system permease protein